MIVVRHALAYLALAVLISGCAVQSYSLVAPGQREYDGLRVSAAHAWNLAPKQATRASRDSSRVWTRDGLLLNRILIIPAVPDGEPIFKPTSKEQALPPFRSGMMPHEIEELTESSIVKLFGESDVVVETSNLRPHRFGNTAGFLFDLEMAVSDGPDYAGIVGAMVSGRELYLVIYIAAKPYYYQKLREEALSIILSARV